jgi:DNA repair protein RadC
MPLAAIPIHLKQNKSERLHLVDDQDLPREKLKNFGARFLTDSELLAIILRTGTTDKHVLDLSKEVIKDAGSLGLLFRKNWKELSRIKGIGQVKAITLEAVFELTRRADKINIADRPQFNSAKEISNFFIPMLRDQIVESIYVVSCDVSLRLLSYKEVSIGTTNSATFDVTVAIKEVVLQNAYNVFLVHNHPSGNQSASQSDIAMTKRFKEACTLIGVQLTDHVIVCGNNYFSFSEANMI